MAVRIGVRDTFSRSTSASSDNRSPALSSPLRNEFAQLQQRAEFCEDGPSIGSAIPVSLEAWWAEAVYNFV